MKSRSEVLRMVQAKIRLRHFTHSTEQAYCHWTGRYYDFCLRLPKSWSGERKIVRAGLERLRVAACADLEVL